MHIIVKIYKWLKEHKDLVETITLIVLIINLFVFTVQTCEIRKQTDLAQKYNQPFYDIKSIDLNKSGTDANGNVFELDIILKNYGKYVGSISYDISLYGIEKESEKNDAKVINRTVFNNINAKNKIIMSPDNEYKIFLAFLPEKLITDYVSGYKKIFIVETVINYNDYKGIHRKYTCNYLITRLQSKKIADNPYDVQFYNNKME